MLVAAGLVLLGTLLACTAQPPTSAPPPPATATPSPTTTRVPASPTPSATVPHLPGLRPGWTTFTAADEVLADKHLRAIAVAPDGALWLGTDWGVLRFDGTTWTSPTQGLPSFNVLALAQGPAGGIWAGTRKGLTRFDGQRWVRYRRGPYCPYAYCSEPERISSIAVAPDGALWFIEAVRISRFDGEVWDDRQLFESVALFPSEAIAVTPAGDLWIGTLEGAFHVSGKTLIHTTTEDGLAHDAVEAILAAPDGTVWFGTALGVSRWDGTTWTSYTTADGLAGNRVKDIALAPDGALWFATTTGISRYMPEPPIAADAGPAPAFTPIPTCTPTLTPLPTRTPRPTITPTPRPTPTPLPEEIRRVTYVDAVISGTVEALQAAPDGGLWLVTEQGVARRTAGDWSVYLTDVTGDIVGIDAAGRVWVIGQDAEEIAAWNGATWTTYGADAGWVPFERGWYPGGNWGTSDGQGRFWLPTSEDVRVFEDGRWTVFTPEAMGMGEVAPEELVATFTIEVVERTGTVWVGTCDWGGPGPFGGQGVRWYDGATWHGADAPVASGCTVALEEDGVGGMWVGLDARLWHVAPDTGRWTELAPPEPPIEWTRFGFVHAIAVDPSGDPWPAMVLCGASCYGKIVTYHVSPDGAWTQIGEVQEYGGLSPYRLVPGAPDEAWLLSDFGVYRIVGDTPELMATLYIRAVAVDTAGRPWFVAWHQGRDALWTVNK
jgi:hypothetical protein